MKQFLYNKKKGLASLPAVLLFGGIMIEIGIAGAFLVYYLNTNLYGTRIANQTLVVAQAGIDDAVLRVIQDKTCPNPLCPASYTIQVENGTANVTLCKDTCGGENTTVITSTGTILTKQRQLTATLTVDPATGLVTINSVTETGL